MDSFVQEIKNAILPELPAIIEAAIKKQSSEALNEKFLSIDETMKLFDPRPSRTTIYNWMDAGLLNSYTFGGKRYFKYSEVLESVQRIKKYSRNNLKNDSVTAN